MDVVGRNALKRASCSGSRSDVTMPNQQQAVTWKALPSGKPKIEPANEINDLLYANVGVLWMLVGWLAMVLGCREGVWPRVWMYCGQGRCEKGNANAGSVVSPGQDSFLALCIILVSREGADDVPRAHCSGAVV
jgi:hypothetical protein